MNLTLTSAIGLLLPLLEVYHHMVLKLHATNYHPLVGSLVCALYQTLLVRALIVILQAILSWAKKWSSHARLCIITFTLYTNIILSISFHAFTLSYTNTHTVAMVPLLTLVTTYHKPTWYITRASRDNNQLTCLHEAFYRCTTTCLDHHLHYHHHSLLR